MEISSTATSGRRLDASSSASAPVDASATTLNPGALSSTCRIPVRTIAWSSATSTRIGSSVMADPARPPGPAPRAARRRRTPPGSAPFRPAHRSARACPPTPYAPHAPSCSGVASALTPRPSSRTSSSTPARLTEIPTSTDRALAWRRTLESASCKARKSASSACSESGGKVAGVASPTRIPLRSLNSATSERSAGSSPRSSNSEGRRSLVTLRMLRIPVSMRPSTWSSRAVCAGGALSRMTPSSIRTAEKTWPVSSCSSRESRRRSSSCCSTILAESRASSTVRSSSLR